MSLPHSNGRSWYAWYDGEKLPCVWEYWKKGLYYDDPGCRPGHRFWPNFIKAIRDGRKVIVTGNIKKDDESKKSKVRLSRDGYKSVWTVKDVQADEKSLRFDFVDEIDRFSADKTR